MSERSSTCSQEPYVARSDRYERATLPPLRAKAACSCRRISLGLWQNFGDASLPSQQTERASLVLRAFDLGITHFDLANNYGPPPRLRRKAISGAS